VSRNSRRSVAIAVAGVFAVAPLVTACAAGRTPQTSLPTQLAEGVNASAHLVDIRNVFLLGPAPGHTLPAGGVAPLYAWFVNRAAAPDKLVAVEAPGVATSADVAGGGVVLPPGKLVSTVQKAGSQPAPPPAAPSATPLPSRTPITGAPTHRRLAPGKTATPTTAPTQPAQPAQPSSQIVLGGLVKQFMGGETVRLTLHFQQAGVISLDVPVVPRTGSYATFAPAAAPAPAPPVTQPAGPNTSPAPGTSATPKTAKARKPKTTA
jgi:copper(I)-binding protein